MSNVFGWVEARDINPGFASVLAGLTLCWLAVRLYHDGLFLMRPRMRALGTVVDHRLISGEGGQTPLLMVRFETDDGQTVDVRVSLGPWSHQIDVGSTIGVEYPAGYPKKARVLGSGSSLLDYGVCFVVLAILAAFALNPKWTTSIW
jgi:hypothetical protein